MILKDAFVRAVRSAAQAFVAGVVLTGVGAFESIDEVKGTGIQFAFAAVYACFVGLVSFVQNIAEDNTSAQLPK